MRNEFPQAQEMDLHRLESYDYELPSDRIAQYPVTPRDSSRLLYISRQTGTFEDSIFRSLPDYLNSEDLLVLNETKVIPARILCERGEIMLVREVENACWDCMVQPGKKFKPGSVFTINGMEVEILNRSTIGRVIRFKGDVQVFLSTQGRVPLPPYIQRVPESSDNERYQTVYARHPGSIAAPTAGMHFTEKVFQDLRQKNVETCKITLHVGPGTFQPVKSADVTQHKLDPEYYSCSERSWRKIQNATRVIAVGTTTTRALETIAATSELTGNSNLFIYPGYNFLIVQGLLTNFHLPKSSLLMLVSAFAGYELMRAAYSHAVEKKYRFYSYGDATLIL